MTAVNDHINYRTNNPAFGYIPPAPELPGALCAEVDSELFFPHPHATTQQEEAKSVCRGCPARTPCLSWSLAQHEALPYGIHGVWGGMTEDDRHKLLRTHRRQH